MEKYELIAAYINNELDATAKANFETQLQNDAQLAEDVAIYKAIENNMQLQTQPNEAALLKNLQPLQQQYFSNTTPTTASLKTNNNGKVRKMIIVALSAAALLALVFLLVKPSSNLNTKELYAQYAIHETVNNTIRSGTASNATLDEATKLYNAKNYKAAIPLLQQIKDSSVQAKLMLGIAQLETNDYATALTHFNEISNGSSIFADKAKWYTALTHLKKDDKTATIAALKALNKNSEYYNKAQELLKKL